MYVTNYIHILPLFFLFFFLLHNSWILLLLLLPSVMLLYIANSINHASLRFSSILLTNIYNSTMSTCIHTKSPASLPFIFSWPLSFLTQQTKKKSLHHSLRRIYHLSHWYKYLSIIWIYAHRFNSLFCAYSVVFKFSFIMLSMWIIVFRYIHI